MDETNQHTLKISNLGDFINYLKSPDPSDLLTKVYNNNSS